MEFGDGEDDETGETDEEITEEHEEVGGLELIFPDLDEEDFDIDEDIDGNMQATPRFRRPHGQ